MLVVIFAGLVVFVAVKALRRRGDVPRAILESATRGLPPDRQDWGRAMLAELGAIEGGLARARFALGCARVALAPPMHPGTSRRSRNTVVAVGGATLGLAVYTRVRLVGAGYPDSTQHGAAYEFVLWLFVLGVITAYVTVALTRLRATTSRARAPRRYGLVAGVVSGVVVLLACSPGLMRPSDSDPLSLVPNGWLFLGALAVPFAMSIVAARATHRARTGLDTGWWAGVISGAIVVIGLLLLTYAATRWFVHDPATLTAYRSYWPPRGTHQTHFRNTTAFLVNANLGTAAIIGVLTLPVLCYLAGAIGSAIGVALPTPRTR